MLFSNVFPDFGTFSIFNKVHQTVSCHRRTTPSSIKGFRYSSWNWQSNCRFEQDDEQIDPMFPIFLLYIIKTDQLQFLAQTIFYKIYFVLYATTLMRMLIQHVMLVGVENHPFWKWRIFMKVTVLTKAGQKDMLESVFNLNGTNVQRRITNL